MIVERASGIRGMECPGDMKDLAERLVSLLSQPGLEIQKPSPCQNHDGARHSGIELGGFRISPDRPSLPRPSRRILPDSRGDHAHMCSLRSRRTSAAAATPGL